MFNKLSRLIMICLIGFVAIGKIERAHAQSDDSVVTASFSDLGYNDIQLKGLYGTNSIWIPFQSDWSVGNVEVQLTYAASPLLNSENAILTVLAGDQEITSIRPIGDGQNHTFSFIVPPQLQLVTGLSLTFDGHLRLTDLFCEDSFNTGQWLIIRNSSTVAINLDEASSVPELTDLPHAILVQGEGDNITPVTFILPEQADDLTLTVAAQVAARLGTGMESNNLPFRTASATNLTEEQKNASNLVIVGLPSNQPLISQLSDLMPVPPSGQGFVSEDGLPIPAGDGVLQIFSSPWRARGNILIVSGNDPAGLAMAGQAFADRVTFQSLTGSFHFVHSLVNKLDGDQVLPWQDGQATFSQLGEFDRQVKGLGITNSYYFFRYPAGVMLGDGAQLLLHIAFSPALRTQNSYVVASVNDIYVGAINVNAIKGDSWVALDLPVQALNQLAREGHTRQLDLQFSIANLLPTNNCDQVDKDSSWTQIYADSYFQFNFVPVVTPDLYFFPYPFVSTENTMPVRFVLPDAPSDSEIQATLSMAALLGNGSLADLNLEIHRVGIETPSGLAGRQVILLGTPDRNPLITAVLEDVKADVPVDIYQTLSTPQTGFFHTVVSPWDAQTNVLVVYGDNEEGFNAAADAIYKNQKLVDESGSIALVRPGEAPVVIYRDAGLEQPEILHPEVIQSADGGPAPEATAIVPTADNSSSTGQQPQPSNITGTERLILIITVFLVILVAVGALVRVAWRIRP